MRRSTIETLLSDITDLSNRIAAINSEYNKECRTSGYSDPTTLSAILKLEQAQFKRINKAKRQLYAASLCESLDGMTIADTVRPEFDGLNIPWELSDGSWC
jgi:hypothetical protein